MDIATKGQETRWAERLATSGIFLITGFGIGAWAAALPALKAKLLLTDGLLSVALLSFAVGAVIAMPIAGVLAPRVGTGRATKGCAILFAVSLTLPLMANTLVTLAVATFLMGAAKGVLDVAMNSHASTLEQRWGQPIMSSFHAAFSAGGLLGAGTGAAFATTGFGVTAALLFAAVLAAVLTLGAWRSLSPGARTVQRFELRAPSSGALILCTIALFCMLCEGAAADWSAVYLATVAQASAAVSASGYAAFSAAMLAGRFVGDGLVRRLGGRQVIALGAGTAALGFVLITIVPSATAAALCFGFIGLGLSNVVPVVFSATRRLGGTGASAIAMAATAGYAGFLIGPVLVGAAATAVGLHLAFVLLAALVAAVVPLAWGAPSR